MSREFNCGIDARGLGVQGLESPVHYRETFLHGAYWAFEESAAPWKDSNNGDFPLTPLPTNIDASSTAGKIANGAGLANGLNNSFTTFLTNATLVDSGGLQPTGWTAAGWHKLGGLNSLGGYSGRIFRVELYSLIPSLQMAVEFGPSDAFNPSAPLDFVLAIPAGFTEVIPTIAPDLNWLFWVAWWDASDGKFHLRLNDADAYVSAHSVSPGLPSVNAKFYCGGTASGGAAVVNSCDETLLLPKKLTDSQRTWLFNGGAGRTWPEAQILF